MKHARYYFKAPLALLVLLVSLAGLNSPAAAKRLAFIVGNDAYENVTPLKKAANDAQAIAGTLKDLGFETHLHQNVARRDMNSALASFTGKIEKNDEVLFFFSGHGIAVRGENYLLPTDVPAVAPGQEGFITREAFAEDEIIRSIQNAGARVAILILDACRNNPFPRKGTRSLGRSVGLGRQVAPPQGTFVMYSAGVGQEALDRLSEDDPHPNSVYTRKLIPLLKTQGLQIVRVAKRLRAQVESLAKTAKAGPHKQYPSYYDELRGDFYFLEGADEEISEKENKQAGADEGLWQTIAKSKKVSDFEFYLKEFPQGRFSAIARLRINQLNTPKDTKQIKTPDATPDETYWGLINHSNKISDYADYIIKFPSGAYKAEALDKIKSLKQLALLTTPKKPQTKSLKVGEIFLDCDACPEMVVVPSGTYTMGQTAPPTDKFRITEPRHKITIAKPFAISKFEITRKEYERFIAQTGHDVGNLCWTVERSGSKYRKNRSYRVTGMPRVDTYPTVCTNWLDAKAYVKWLNSSAKANGKPGTYRLPTEAEWEYVARAGGKTGHPFSSSKPGLCSFGNHAAREVSYKWKNKSCTDRYKKLAPVGSYAANLWGVHDMFGNVQEWTEDCAHYNYKGAPADGSAWLSANHGNCAQRILRGGGWTSGTDSLTPGSRHYTKTTDRTVIYGIRVVKDLD